jgi:hypothetical protein
MVQGHHDIGGVPGARPIDQSEHPLSGCKILGDTVIHGLFSADLPIGARA